MKNLVSSARYAALFVVLASLSAGAAEAKAVKNTSGLKITAFTAFPGNYGTPRPKGAQLCRGTLPLNTDSAGILDLGKRAKNGLACITADFDGNGYLDSALLETGWNQDETGIATTKVVVLFFDGKGWLRTVILPRQVVVSKLGLYPPAGRKRQFGGPVTPIPGLVEFGDGDITRYFLYDPKARKFQMTTHSSEE